MCDTAYGVSVQVDASLTLALASLREPQGWVYNCRWPCITLTLEVVVFGLTLGSGIL